MLEVALAGINSFAYKANFPVPPSEQLITLTVSQLQELIKGAVQEATEPILQELNALGARQDALEAKISSGKVPDSQPEIVALNSALEARSDEIRALKTELEALEENTARERAYDRQRLAALEHREPTPSEKTMEHVDELYTMMKREGHPPLSLARAARLLGLSKRRLNQLLPQVRQDQRFDIVRDPHHKQRLLIRLRKFAGG